MSADHEQSQGGPDPRPHRVVIIGAGFAGLSAARALRGKNVDVTVIDRTNHHLFQPLLYQVATGVLAEGDIAPATRDVLRNQENTRVILGEVSAIDLGSREVALSMRESKLVVSYDSLIVAAGATQSYFGHDEFALFAPSLKTIDDALELRGRILGAFELAEIEQRPDARAAALTFAVVGAGPTGVEVAGQIAELSRRAFKGNFTNFDPSTTRVVLINAQETVLPSFPESLQRRARRDLERVGVEVLLGARVTNVDTDGLEIETSGGSSQRIAAATKVWAAGVQASPVGRMLADQSPAEIDSSGRVEVRSDCSLPGFAEVFVVGDLMSLEGLPGVAEVAMQSGRCAANTIAARLAGRQPEWPFRYRDLGTMVTIARFRAVGYRGRVRVTGLLGWVIWLFVHVAFLTGFKNRIAAVAGWGVSFVGRDRRQRTITRQQVTARSRLLEAGATGNRAGSAAAVADLR